MELNTCRRHVRDPSPTFSTHLQKASPVDTTSGTLPNHLGTVVAPPNAQIKAAWLIVKVAMCPIVTFRRSILSVRVIDCDDPHLLEAGNSLDFRTGVVMLFLEQGGLPEWVYILIPSLTHQ